MFRVVARRQRAQGATTSAAVVDAALTVADERGLRAVTIRSLARQVGCPPMSLYAHFRTKEELLDQMHAELSRRMYADEGHPEWQTELLVLCHRVRNLLRAHPNWAALLSRPAPPLAVPVRERILSLMVRDGIQEQDAFRRLSSCVLVAMGLALTELTLRLPSGESAIEKRWERLRGWAKSGAARDHAVTRAALAKLGGNHLDDVFDFTLEILISGFKPTSSTGNPTG
jgi:AcrR family transcriptional regulator